MDPDLWTKPKENGNGYDYIATHVDDLIVLGKTPQEYIAPIEQEFAVRNVESEPEKGIGLFKGSVRLSPCFLQNPKLRAHSVGRRKSVRVNSAPKGGVYHAVVVVRDRFRGVG